MTTNEQYNRHCILRDTNNGPGTVDLIHGLIGLVDVLDKMDDPCSDVVPAMKALSNEILNRTCYVLPDPVETAALAAIKEAMMSWAERQAAEAAK